MAILFIKQFVIVGRSMNQQHPIDFSLEGDFKYVSSVQLGQINCSKHAGLKCVESFAIGFKVAGECADS